MIKFENTEVVGWEAAIRGMRNPKNSWEKSDSRFCIDNCDDCQNLSICQSVQDESWFKKFWEGGPIDTNFCVGPNDHKLMETLANGGPVHAKYRRMIAVYVDITAPLYWWKEFDTYKVGTVANSCSTMHKIAAKEFTLDDFSHEHLVSGWASKDNAGNFCIMPGPFEALDNMIRVLNRVRDSYLVALITESETGLPAKDIWWQMIQLLPSSYNQRRTVMLNYEVLANIYPMRKNHKLDEWRDFCEWIKTLPYNELITFEKDEPEETDHDISRVM